MADIKDVTAVIASALAEVNVSGELDVQMDGRQAVQVLDAMGEPVKVVVSVEPVEKG